LLPPWVPASACFRGEVRIMATRLSGRSTGAGSRLPAVAYPTKLIWVFAGVGTTRQRQPFIGGANGEDNKIRNTVPYTGTEQQAVSPVANRARAGYHRPLSCCTLRFEHAVVCPAQFIATCTRYQAQPCFVCAGREMQNRPRKGGGFCVRYGWPRAGAPTRSIRIRADIYGHGSLPEPENQDAGRYPSA